MSGSFRAVLMAVLMVVGLSLAVMVPQQAAAWPTKYTNCTNCHTAADPDGAIYTAINGASATSISGLNPLDTFEIDFYFTNVTNGAGGFDVGLYIAVPDNTWTVASGTSNAPTIGGPGWSTAWDAASGVGWATGNGFSSALAGTTQAYTIDFGGSAWDGDGTGGGKTRNPANDGHTAGDGTDLDGVAERMGADATITVPAGASGAYTIYVVGVGHEGSGKSNVIQAITVNVGGGDTTPPTFAGATGATDAGTGGAVDLTWAAATDPSTPITYNVYYATTPGGQNFGAAPQATTTNATGVQVTGLTDSQIYYFVVRAEDSAANEETNVVEVSATPTTTDTTPPTFAGATGATDAGTGGAVDLTWAAATDPSTPITYNIYYATTSGGQNFGAAPQATTTNGTGVQVTGLTNSQIYYFVVRAEDAATNEETNVVEVSATPTSPDVTPPTFAGATGATDAGTGGAVDLTWVAATDPSTPITYNIYYATTSGGQNFGAAPQATSSSGTGAQVTGLTDDQIYYFVVRAEDAATNEETNVVEVSATPTSPGNIAPNAPASLVQYQSDGTTAITQNTFNPDPVVATRVNLVMKATVTDPNADTVQLEVEIVDYTSAFTNTPNCVSGVAVASGGTAEATCSGLADGRYKWQARAIDSSSATSSWLEY